jgi:hydrogenase expression/formation protein HypC
MCLAVPGRLVEIEHEGDLLMGKVDFGGVRKRACLEYVKEAKLGDYVLVHVGFALSRIDEEEAVRIFALLAEMNELPAPDDSDAQDGATRGGAA